MIQDNLYQDEAFEAGVRSVVSRFSIREDYCETCNDDVNFIKIQDCSDYWRCMGCLNLFKRKFSSLEDRTFFEARKKENGKNIKSEPDEYDIARAKANLKAKEFAEKEMKEKKSEETPFG